MVQIENARWNGERCKAYHVDVQLLDSPCGDSQVLWFIPFTGQIRRAIKVYYSNQEPFFIDNEDGQGFIKITVGGGGFSFGHKSYGNIEELGYTVPERCITERLKEVTVKDDEISEAYWMERKPDIVERLKSLKKVVINSKNFFDVVKPQKPDFKTVIEPPGES